MDTFTNNLPIIYINYIFIMNAVLAYYRMHVHGVASNMTFCTMDIELRYLI